MICAARASISKIFPGCWFTGGHGAKGQQKITAGGRHLEHLEHLEFVDQKSGAVEADSHSLHGFHPDAVQPSILIRAVSRSFLARRGSKAKGLSEVTVGSFALVSTEHQRRSAQTLRHAQSTEAGDFLEMPRGQGPNRPDGPNRNPKVRRANKRHERDKRAPMNRCSGSQIDQVEGVGRGHLAKCMPLCAAVAAASPFQRSGSFEGDLGEFLTRM